MIGRAGRPQYDNDAIACLFVKQDKKNYMVNRFGKFTNYENINHINKLNAI